jgi:flagellin-specific chaperone FliS
MNPYRAYRKPEPSTGWTRMDTLLALYDGALDRLNRAEAALRAGQELAALPLLAKAQLIVVELASGVRTEVNPEAGTNMLRLYEYVAHELRRPKLEGVQNARKVLLTLRDGFEAVRDEANQLERSGQLPAAEQLQLVAATA